MIIVRNPPPADPALDPELNPGRLVFEAWGQNSPRVFTPPDPCLVCGEPLNACTDHAPTTEAEMPRETRIQGTTEVNTDVDSNLFVVPEDVVEEYVPAGGASRPSWRLVHHQGEVISRERAVQLGLIEGPAQTSPVPPAETVVVEGPPVTPTQH